MSDNDEDTTSGNSAREEDSSSSAEEEESGDEMASRSRSSRHRTEPITMEQAQQKFVATHVPALLGDNARITRYNQWVELLQPGPRTTEDPAFRPLWDPECPILGGDDTWEADDLPTCKGEDVDLDKFFSIKFGKQSLDDEFGIIQRSMII